MKSVAALKKRDIQALGAMPKENVPALGYKGSAPMGLYAGKTLHSGRLHHKLSPFDLTGNLMYPIGMLVTYYSVSVIFLSKASALLRYIRKILIYVMICLKSGLELGEVNIARMRQCLTLLK